MAKCYVEIGFITTVEDPVNSGIWIEEDPIEKPYYADVIRNIRNLGPEDKVNSDINLNNSISIIGDPYAQQNFFAIRYAKIHGAKWKVSSVDASQYPRLVLSVGGVYDGR